MNDEWFVVDRAGVKIVGPIYRRSNAEDEARVLNEEGLAEFAPYVVIDAIEATITNDEALTVMEIADRLCGPLAWQERMNVRNRLYRLVAEGRLICDEGRPMRFALNQVVV